MISSHPFQSRETAMQGDFVRLFCVFTSDGVLRDPSFQPMVRIMSNHQNSDGESSGSSDFSNSSERSYSSESSTSSASSASSASSLSSSTRSNSEDSSNSVNDEDLKYGPFHAIKMHTGIWYVDWFVPEDAAIGDWFDVWHYQINPNTEPESLTFKFEVHKGDAFINFSTSPSVSKMGDVAVSLINGLKTNLLEQATDIPVYWEQGMVVGENKLNFAFKNWRNDQPVLLRKNNRIISDWTPDFNGNALLPKKIAPEDMFYAHYHFSYFSDEDLLSILNEGLMMMNTVPPATQAYSNIASAPFSWRGGIILYAAMQALRKVIFGFTWQERAIIFGEKPEDAQRFIDNCKSLYSDYSTLWMEVRKDIKKALPSISIHVTPEYTLPGGRSRWFRYMYKSGV